MLANATTEFLRIDRQGTKIKHRFMNWLSPPNAQG